MKTDIILNGSAYDLIKDLPDHSIDLIITDPPYDIGSSHASGIMKNESTRRYVSEIEKAKINKGFDYSILDEFVRVMKKINIYIFCNKKQVPIYLNYFAKLDTNYDFLIWEKDNPVPLCGTHYLVDKEYCLFFWEQGAYLYVPYERGRTIYRSHTNTADKEIYKHPTIKNINMIETLIKNSSEAGEIVLDPFLGSGTTARAAKNLGRRYIGYEIDEDYYKIACDRLKGINAKGELNIFELDNDETI